MADGVKSLIDDIIHNTDNSYPAGKGPVYDKDTVGAEITHNNFPVQTFDKGKFKEKLSLYVLKDLVSAMMADDVADVDHMVDDSIMRHIRDNYNGSWTRRQIPDRRGRCGSRETPGGRAPPFRGGRKCRSATTPAHAPPRTATGSLSGRSHRTSPPSRGSIRAEIRAGQTPRPPRSTRSAGGPACNCPRRSSGTWSTPARTAIRRGCALSPRSQEPARSPRYAPPGRRSARTARPDRRPRRPRSRRSRLRRCRPRSLRPS